MAAAIVILGMIDTGALAKGLVAVGLLSVFVSMMILATGQAEECKGNLIAMAVVIGIFAASLAVLSFIDPSKLAGAVAAMGILMSLFALMELTAQYTKGAMSSLITMAAIIALLGTTLYVLAQLPIESTLSVAISLSALLVALSVACGIMSTIPVAGAIQGAIGLAAFAGILTGALVGIMTGVGALSKIDGFDELMDAGGGVLAKIGYAIGAFIGQLGAGLTSGLPDIGENLSAFMENISGFIDGMKQVDSSVISGVGAFAKAIVALSVADFIAGITNLLPFCDSFEELGLSLSQFAVNALPFIMTSRLIEKESMEGVNYLAEAVKTITKAEILDGITSFGSDTSKMEKFAEQISIFGEAIVDFSNVVSENIDNDSVNAAANAGAAIAGLYDSLPRSGGIFQNIFGDLDLSNFAVQLADFGKAIVEFSKAVSEEGAIDNTAVDNAANAGKAVAGLYDEIPKTGGKFQNIFGEEDLTVFSSQMEAFGTAIVNFSGAVSANDGVNTEAVEKASQAGKAIAELYANIPKTGGKFQNIFGEQNLFTFATQLQSFGSAIADFSGEVKDKVDSGTVDAAVAAGNAVSGLYAALPQEEGVLDKIKNFFVGGSSIGMDELGEAMVTFGDAVSDFAESLPEELDTDMITNVSTAAKRIGTMYTELGEVNFDVAEEFQNAVGKLKTIFDTIVCIDLSSVDGFISAVEDIATMNYDVAGLTSMADSIAYAVDSLVTSITVTISNGKSSVTSSTESMMGGVPIGINKSTTSAKSAVKTLISAMENSITTSTHSVVTTMKTLIDAVIKKVTNSESSMKSAAKTMMNGVPKGVEQCTSSAKTAIRTLISSMETTVSNKESSMKQSFKSLASSGVSGIRDAYSSFEDAGKYLVQGFANGISSNTYIASAKAKAMADAAATAAAQALDMKKREECLQMHPYKIWQGKDGKWYTYLPDEEKGRVKKKRTSKKEIENVVVIYWQNKAENPTIEEIFNEWNERRLALHKIQQSTFDRDKRLYSQHYADFGKWRVKELEPEEISDFLEERIAECELTAKAFSNLKGITKGFLKYAKKKKLINFSVQELFDDLDVSDRDFRKVVKEDYEEVFSESDWDTIVPYLIDHLDIWNIGILLMFITGIRIGELSTLKHSDFSKDGRTLNIRRTETSYKDENGKDVYAVKEFPKSKAGVRSIALPEDYAWFIEKIKWLNPSEEYIFVRNSKRMTTNCFRRRLEKIEKKLGIYHKSPHKIRKTYGSILLDNNLDNRFVLDQMGHSTIGVTESCYHRNRRTTDKKVKVISEISEFKGTQRYSS